ncbi:MAG TPA: tRNA uridine-5-carboxymethylaminomethyl(34) synthesis GTPase MnmE, partial [candidate division Zixibacteria bacterium]|nr:tRNA uridine-5-carboxymethylaminomethyl(34) synthesis GTPase MnmE [candidate division Zixibacteria bacterium]
DRREDPQTLTDTVTGIPSILISAQTGTGIEALIAQIKAWIAQAGVTDASDQMAINDRHRHALARADSALARALDTLSRNGANLELAAFDANTAASALGEIIGTTTTDEILGEIFSNFCIGK